MKIIETKNLTRIYQVPVKQGLFKSIFVPKNRDVVAVKKLNLSIKEGESVALLGPNGAGKTTTLKMLTGLLYPTLGKIKVLGYIPTDRKYAFLSQIALVMGNKSGLSWDLSASQSFKLFQSIYRLKEKEVNKTVEQLTGLLEVTEVLNVPVRKLSLGQRLKMELVGAILHKPKLLFLDEPTIGLDVIAKRKIRSFLRDLHRQEGTTILLTSHEMADVEKVCDRVVVINRGRLVFDDSLVRLNRQYQDKKYLTVSFEKKVLGEEFSRFGEVVKSGNLSHTLEIHKKDQSKIISEIVSSFPVADIDIQSVPLDEIIEDIFERTSS